MVVPNIDPYHSQGWVNQVGLVETYVAERAQEGEQASREAHLRPMAGACGNRTHQPGV